MWAWLPGRQRTFRAPSSAEGPPLTGGPMILMQNVSKSFGRTMVLNDLTFTVPAGETVALLGLSGSGKTTALKLVCGLHFPDQGFVEVAGERLAADRLLELRRGLGYVIQDGGLFPHLTAFGNLSLVGNEAGWDKSRIRSRVDELAELTKIPAAALQRYPRELSGGQRQRVGLMRALLLDPAILLLDEPMGALDPITRAELQDELKDLFSRLGKTVLLVTHDLFEAGHLAGKILLLNQGRIAQAGPLEELVKRPADEFVGRFVRSQRRPEEAP
jgi:osmoprotectant transport system ATP-binding protein